MPCSRIEAPFAQCAPRLSGESNTGSWRTQTPFCTTASIAQPTEQCVHTERFRNARRSIVFASTDCSPLARRGWTAALLVAFLVNSMAGSSDLRGAVVVIDVRAFLVPLRRTLAFT